MSAGRLNRAWWMRASRLGLAMVALAPLAGCMQMQQLRARNQGLEGEVERLREENRQLEQAYYEINEGRAGESRSLRAEMETLQRELEQARDAQSRRERELEDRLNAATMQIEAMRSEFEARQEIADAQTLRLSGDAEEERLARQAAEGRIAELEAERDTALAEAEEARQAAQERQAEIEAARAESRTQVQAAQAGQTELEQRTATLEGELAERDRRIASLEQELAARDEALGGVRAEVERLQAELENVNGQQAGEVAQLQGRVQELEGELNDARQAAAGPRIDPALENIASELNERLARYSGGQQVLTSLTPAGLRIVVPSDFAFQKGTINLSDGSKPILKDVASFVIERLPERRVRIEGHTDDQPVFDLPFADNWGLSHARADSVRKFLIQEGGLKAENLEVVARAYFEPIERAATAEARAKNRRVEIVILPQQRAGSAS